MTNAQIIENLFKKLSVQIEWRMTDFEESYEEAKEKVSKDSVAGVAVWAKLDEKYGQ